MSNTNSPTLLEIVNRHEHWSEYVDIDGYVEEHEFNETNPITKLMQVQRCGFWENYMGHLYGESGEFLHRVLVEIEDAVHCTPSITIDGVYHRTQDLKKITSDTLFLEDGCAVVIMCKMEDGE